MVEITRTRRIDQEIHLKSCSKSYLTKNIQKIITKEYSHTQLESEKVTNLRL